MEGLRQEPKVSVYMITYDNERTVEKALRSVTWADEMVVVDSFSNDRTAEICRQFTDKLFQRKWPGHRDQYQYAADLTTHEWIMFVDADEEVSPELAEEIRRELKENAEGVDGFFVYRRTFYLGRWIRYGGWYPDGEIRLYRRNKGRWEGGLHARVVVNGRVQPLKNLYYHYTYRNISDQIQTIDKYSRIAAEEMVKEGEKFSLFKLLFHPPFRFMKEYFFKSGFRDGLPGLVIVISTMYYVFIKYAKLWELTRSTAHPRPQPGPKASPSSEGDEEKGRSGSTLSKPQPSGWDAEGLTRGQKGEKR
jgi:glycosyltransferase involved in cell wall biosynthesis